MIAPRYVFLGALSAAVCCCGGGRAPAGDVAPAATEQSLSEMVRRTVLDNLPREFSGNSDWGSKREVPSGLKFKTEGGRLRIEKRTKEVNDGLWTQYKVSLVDPRQNFRVRVAQLRRSGPGRIGFTLFMSARLDGEVRYERWRRGIKMLNFKADAQSTVEAALDCEVGFRLVPGRFLGDLVIAPQVNAVRLTLVDIDLARISRIDGAVASELGDQLRHSLDKELSGRQNEIAQKLNAAIAAHADKLRFPTERLMAFGWDKAQSVLATLAKLTPAPAPAPIPPAAPLPIPVASPKVPAK